jgi:hypothetical protein
VELFEVGALLSPDRHQDRDGGGKDGKRADGGEPEPEWHGPGAAA